MSKPYRAWINAPSIFDVHHKLHGTNVLAIDDHNGTTIYFLSGPVISQRIKRTSLSKGWKV